RTYINNGLENLVLTLNLMPDPLANGGRLVVISVHSLEDRLVKRIMREQGRGGDVPSYMPVRASEHQPRLKPLGKAIYPSAAEVAENARSRSAVMRAAEKVA